MRKDRKKQTRWRIKERVRERDRVPVATFPVHTRSKPSFWAALSVGIVTGDVLRGCFKLNHFKTHCAFLYLGWFGCSGFWLLYSIKTS